MVIFGAGVVTGGLLVRHSADPRPRREPLAVPSGRVLQGKSPGTIRLEFLRRVQRELELTADQRDRVDALLKESQERTRKLLEPVNPQLRVELQRARDEFRRLLKPEQRRRFDELLRQQQQRPAEQRRLRATEGTPRKPQ